MSVSIEGKRLDNVQKVQSITNPQPPAQPRALSR
jgi:hypothetical protein